jgi:hypothetical protein
MKSREANSAGFFLCERGSWVGKAVGETPGPGFYIAAPDFMPPQCDNKTGLFQALISLAAFFRPETYPFGNTGDTDRVEVLPDREGPAVGVGSSSKFLHTLAPRVYSFS